MEVEVSLLAAFLGGVVSFLSPCVLPIVPGYLAVVAGVSLQELEKPTARVRLGVLRDTLLFVFGFSVVFIGLGLTATALGAFLFEHQSSLTRLSGVLVLAMGVVLLVNTFDRFDLLNSSWKPKIDSKRLGVFGAPVAGLAFGLGWTPCIGPVLASVLSIAAATGNTASGGLLLGVYSVGLGVPFVLAGLAFSQMSPVMSALRRRQRGLVVASSLVLIAFGVLLVSDRLSWVTLKLQSLMTAVGLERLVFLG